MPNGGTHEEIEAVNRGMFRSDFAAIDQHLRRLVSADSEVPFREVLDLASAKDSRVQGYHPDLLQFADIYEAVVRWQQTPPPRAAYVVPEASVATIREIRNLLVGPRSRLQLY
jgi:hypothetical protein